MKQDYELYIFSHAMDILVSASQLKTAPFYKDHWGISIGVEGYGNVGDFNLLAGALNYKGYRTKTGKYIRGSYLKNCKSHLTKRYGEEFVEDLVDWENFGIRIRQRNLNYFNTQNRGSLNI